MRSDYYAIDKRAPASPFALLYPIHSSAGLGVHLTTDLSGQRLAGPDTTWVDAPDHAVDEHKATDFAAAVSRYLPGVEAHHLRPAYAGVRPKLVGPGEPAHDFLIEDASLHGVPGLLSLLGIESPGLTSSLALAEHVASTIAGAQAGLHAGALAPMTE